MTLMSAVAALKTQLDELRQALDNLVWATVQPQPHPQIGHSLVDQTEATAQDLVSLVVESMQALASTSRPAGLLRSLITCQELHNRFTHCFYEQLASPEALEALNGLVHDNDLAWRPWAYGVKDALTQCRQPLHEVGQALIACWQEVGEWADREEKSNAHNQIRSAS